MTGRLGRILGQSRGKPPAADPQYRGWPPPRGTVDFGDFASTEPISREFGFDRGLPIDRYYIERFLGSNSGDVQGRVLEIGDDSYSRRFGGTKVVRQDILHVHPGNPLATLVGDISDPAVVGDALFDCIIFTQTLHLIYDFHAAARRLHAALKPGGVLLLTAPGISQVDRGEWGEGWCWSFTRASMSRIFEPLFGAGGCALEVYGNVFAAVTFLHGVAVEEIDTAKLDLADPAYPVTLAFRGKKSG